jgi:hypothetical protein
MYEIKPYFIQIIGNIGHSEAQAKTICHEYYKRGIDLQVSVYGEIMLASDIWRFD